MKNKFKLSYCPWLLILFGLTFLIVKKNLPDSDTWFILSTGRYILENKTIPTVNPFTIHEGLDIIVQQWLFDVIIYFLYSIGGWAALYIYNIITAFSFFFLFYRLTGYWTDSTVKREYFLLIAGLLILNFECIRPTSFTLLVLCAELIVLEEWKKNRNKKILAILPVLGLLEANMHASFFPFLFVMALPYIVPERLIRPVDKTLLIFFIPTFLVGLINPYGIRGIGYLFLSYGSANQEEYINELIAPSIFSVHGIIIIFCIVCLILYINKYKFNVSLQRVCMAFGTILLASMHLRNLWFLVFGIGPVVLDLIPDFKPFPAFRFQKAFFSFYIILFAVASILCPLNLQDYFTSPILAVEYLESEDDIVLYNSFNNGAYLEWCGYSVYIDARPEIYEEKINGVKDIYSEFLDVVDGTIDYEEFIESYGFTHLIVEESSKFDIYLSTSDDFELVVEGNGYNMYRASD